jgi:Nif-specific regulatory protein
MQASEKHGLIQHACRSASLLATLASRTGSDEDAEVALARAESLARAAGDTSVVLSAVSGMARVQLRSGHLRKAWDLTTAILRTAVRINNYDSIAWSWNRLGMILGLRGRRKAAIRCYRRAIQHWRSAAGHGGVAYSLVNLADMAMDKGFLNASRRLLDRAFESARSVPAVSTWVARARARLAARMGDAAEARRALDQAPGESQVREDAEAHGALLEASALTSFAAGDVARAIATYNQAAALYRGRGYRYHLGRSLTQAARALHDGLTPSPELALQRVEWLREARGVYEQMEAPGPLASILPDLLVLEGDIARREESLPAAEIRDTLYEVSQLLNSILDFPELIHKVLQLVVQRLGAERGLIVLVDPESGELTPVARHGLMDEDAQADALQISTSIVRRVLQTGATFRSDDAVVDPRLATMKSVFDLSLRSILCAALRLRDQVIGTIYLQNRTARGAFTDADIAFLESFSNLVAVAIENSRLHENLRQTNESLVDENVELRRQVPAQFKYANLIGRSREMAQLHALIDRFAQAPGDVLIEGETGTGKELVARTIHYNSPRRDRPFLSINCVALPETLIEAELFGIEDHVATGVRAREGIFQRAEGGSVLLDEIGDMPPGMQARLLRVLQEREFTRVGGKRSIRMSARVFAATNADLRERVRDNRFRADLFFRVNRLVIHIPPLRERKSDIPVLARHFTQRLCETMGRPAPRLSAGLLEVMGRSDWPGNVRELENYIERLLVVGDGPVLEPHSLPGDLEEAAQAASRPAVVRMHGVGATALAEALAAVERELITEAIRRSGGNRSKAARALAMAEPTLRYRMRKLGIRAGEAAREE